jgi:hypothetical protein
MKRGILILCILMLGPAVQACTMAFPAAGVYSGGTLVVQPSSATSFFALLGAAVLLKATVFASLAAGRWWRLFGWMLVANLVTTVLGYFLEVVHVSWFGYFGSMTLLAFPVFYWAVRFLHPTGVLGPLARQRCWPCAFGLLVLFFFTGVLGLVPLQLSPTGAWHWIWKFLFTTTALVVTLFVTTAYEFRILAQRVGLVGREGLAPVLRANFVVFAALFLFATGVLLWRGTYPVP